MNKVNNLNAFKILEYGKKKLASMYRRFDLIVGLISKNYETFHIFYAGPSPDCALSFTDVLEGFLLSGQFIVCLLVKLFKK